MSVLIILGVIVAIVAIWWAGVYFERERRAELLALAGRLSLTYNPDRNPELAVTYDFLNKLRQGDNRYAYDVITGTYQQQPVCCFSYHFETHHTNSKGRRTTHHHHLAVIAISLPRSFPELLIGSEGVLSRIAQAFGYDDIDFESHEFSRQFCVRSPDKKFAYDFCNAPMMEYLLANPDLTLEVDQRALAFIQDSRLSVQNLERDLNRLIQVRLHMPKYLFDT
ncbi:MAG: DUF3137 domain-containing protein [Verrucomicrobia bacterium]|nr:DUF3137 domain-containing protein [Verrucomicrobiota bacterium]MBU4428483.1 DUF3137 domain-containing protein [Verrucomicrobiota bacterium]MCG2680365.1 DUF3137 domain-containing protein [Kiritimatiellia bacterium]